MELDQDYQAVQIYETFRELGRGNNSNVDQESRNGYVNDNEITRIRVDFPWQEIAKHFDGVYHGAWSSRDSDFLRSWEVESIAWFKTDRLQLLGQVKVARIGNHNPGDDVD